MEFSNTEKSLNKRTNAKLNKNVVLQQINPILSQSLLLNDHENIGVLLTESALESEHKSSICMVSQTKNKGTRYLK